MRYTNKKILKITFPVLVCLLMEQLIGLTDTAYLGRVAERRNWGLRPWRVSST